VMHQSSFHKAKRRKVNITFGDSQQLNSPCFLCTSREKAICWNPKHLPALAGRGPPDRHWIRRTLQHPALA
jgi:hypothetical protein